MDVATLREWHKRAPVGGPAATHTWVGILLTEIDRLEQWSAELTTINAVLRDEAVEALTRLRDAEAVCGAAQQYLTECEASARGIDAAVGATRRRLKATLALYLAGKKETDDGEEEGSEAP